MVMLMTLIEGQQPEPFEEFETFAEVLGMVNKQLGLDGVRQVLNGAGDEHCAEYLHMVSAELLTAGLKQVAAAVDEFAANAPSAVDLRHCTYSKAPYTDNLEANRANIWAWQRSRNRLVAGWARKRKAFLRRAAINSR
jgi:hypothetical protein